MAGGGSNNNRSMRDSLPLPSESFVVLTRSQVGQNQVPSSSSPLASYSTSSPATTTTTAIPSSTTTNHPVTTSHHTTTSTTASNNQHHQQHTATTTTTSTGGNNTTTGSSSTHDDTGNRNNTLSHRLRVANRLFNIISSKSSIDHPMCQECTDLLLESLERELEDVSRERDAYIEFFAKIKENRVDDEMRQELEHVVEQVCPCISLHL